MTDGRDRSIETLLRQRRESDVGSQVSPQCLDGEAFAAWMDGALSGKALADAETHAASCARCQALLASLAKTMPSADARAWWPVLSAKWLVPVAAVATALLVWVSVEQSPEPAPKPVSSVAAPVEGTPAPAAAPAEPVIPEQNAQSQDARLRGAADASKTNKETVKRRPGAASASGQLAEEKVASQTQRLDALDKTADAIVRQSGARSESPKDAAQPVASATPPVASPPPPPAAPAPPPQSRATVPVPPVAESVTIIPEASKPAGGLGGGAAFAAVPDIRSPQSDYRWRIVPPSGIQRSVDGGVTWSVVDPFLAKDALARESSQIVLTSGSSPARDVCWIVGRAGIVLLTVDGATWQRRPIPEPADLSAVRAVDARTATVTTLDGRQFATSDGGATWVLVK